MGNFYCGSGEDNGLGVATDSIGNTYITGNTTSASAIATLGAYQFTYGGGSGSMSCGRSWPTSHWGNSLLPTWSVSTGA